MVKIFISYAHVDKEYKEQLEKHLSVLTRNGDIAPWTDKMLEAGEVWDKSISDALNDAELIIFLVSSDFLSSEYCYDIEMKSALSRHEERKAIVVPIIVRPCDWTGAPFSRFQVLPAAGKPIKDWPDADQAFLNVVEGLKKSVNTLNRQAGRVPVQSQPAATYSDGGNSGSNGDPAPQGNANNLKYALIGAAAVVLVIVAFLLINNSHSKNSAAAAPADTVAKIAAPAVPTANVPADSKTNNSPGNDAINQPANTGPANTTPANTTPANTGANAITDNTPAAVQVKGDNVMKVVASSGGYFASAGGKKWIEYDANGNAAFYFDETGRDEWSVYLKDDSRNMTLQLDLFKKQIFLNWDRSDRGLLYGISQVYAK